MEAIKRTPSVAESMTQKQVDEMYEIISKEPMREIKWSELVAMSPEERKAWADEGDFIECIKYRHFHKVNEEPKKAYKRPEMKQTSNANIIDAVLVMAAEKISCFQWNKISDMIARAKSETTKSRLKTIMVHKYHIEEFLVGCL